MKRMKIALQGLALLFLAVAVITGAPARGLGANTVVLDVGAAVASSVQLTLGASAIHFPDADPDTVPSVAALENPLSVTASATTNPNRNITLTVLVANDLTSGSNTIPIGNVRWTATGSGFLAGTMSKGASVNAGRWRGSGTRNGTFSYLLTNSWAYKSGNYSTTAVYTLYAP